MIGNSDSDYYTFGSSKYIFAYKISNFNINDEYNLKFKVHMNSAVSYVLQVNLNNGSTGHNIYYYSMSSSSAQDNACDVDVNFTLANLGITSNQNVELEFSVSVPSAFGYNFKIGFSDIVIDNLDDVDYSNDLYNIYGALATIWGEFDEFYSDWQTYSASVTSYLSSILQAINTGFSDTVSTLNSGFTIINDNLNTILSAVNDGFSKILNPGIYSINNSIGTLRSELKNKLNDVLSYISSFNEDFTAYLSALQSSLDNEFVKINDYFEQLINGNAVSDEDVSKLSEGQTQVDSMNDEYSAAEDALPEIGDSVSNTFNTSIFNILELGDAFKALNNFFKISVESLEFMPVVYFVLSFGLAVYVLGRRLYR